MIWATVKIMSDVLEFCTVCNHVGQGEQSACPASYEEGGKVGGLIPCR
jgi:hypothetical protein